MDPAPSAPPSYDEAISDIPKVHGSISQLNPASLSQEAGPSRSALPDHLGFLPVTDPANPLSSMIESEDKARPEPAKSKSQPTKPKPKIAEPARTTYYTSQPTATPQRCNCYNCNGGGCRSCKEQQDRDCAECLCQCACICLLALLQAAFKGK